MWHFSTRITLKNQRCEIRVTSSLEVACWLARYPNLWQPKAIVTRSSRSLSTAWCATRSDAMFWVWKVTLIFLIPSIIRLPMLFSVYPSFIFQILRWKNDRILRKKWSEVVKIGSEEMVKYRNAQHRIKTSSLGMNPPFKDANHQDYPFLMEKCQLPTFVFYGSIGRNVIPRYGTSEALKVLILGATYWMLRMLRYIVLQATHIDYDWINPSDINTKTSLLECPCNAFRHWHTHTHYIYMCIYIFIIIYTYNYQTIYIYTS